MKIILFSLLMLAMAPATFAQSREHLTEKEIDWIREEQLIDKRIEVFVKAADRRLLVLSTPDAKQTKKEEEKWGPLPTGTTLELLQDYKKILEEAEEKLDDAFERKPKDELIIKALKKFKDGATKHISLLQSMEAKMKDKREQMALAEAIEEAEAVTKGDVNK